MPTVKELLQLQSPYLLATWQQLVLHWFLQLEQLLSLFVLEEIQLFAPR